MFVFFHPHQHGACAVKRIARPCEVCVAGVTHTPHLSCVKVRRIFRLSLNNKIITIAPCAREAIKRKGAERQKQKKTSDRHQVHRTAAGRCDHAARSGEPSEKSAPKCFCYM